MLPLKSQVHVIRRFIDLANDYRFNELPLGMQFCLINKFKRLTESFQVSYLLELLA